MDLELEHVEERINSPKYKSWIKGTLALVHISEIVRDFVKDIFDEFYKALPDNGKHFLDGTMTQWMCQRTEWNKGKWELKTNSRCDCQELFRLVLEKHSKKDRSVGFDNCRIKAAAGSWGIAQLFMPKYCDNVTSPADTDPYALFNTILHCTLFNVSHVYVEKIIQGRNKLMHSTTNTFEDSEKRELFDAMNKFLEEAIRESKNVTTKQKLDSCQTEIGQISDSEITTSLMSAKAKTTLEYKRSIVKEEVKNSLISGDLNREDIEKYLNVIEQLGRDLAFWDKCDWDLQKMKEKLILVDNIDKMKKEIETTINENVILKKQNDVLKKENDVLQNENDVLKKQKDVLKKQNDGLKEENEGLMKENDGIKNENDELKKQNDFLNEGNDVLKKDNERIKKINNDLNNELKENLSTSDLKISSLTEELKSTMNEVDELNENLQTIRNENKKIRDDYQTSREENRSLCEEIHRKEKTIDTLKTEIQTYKRSLVLCSASMVCCLALNLDVAELPGAWCLQENHCGSFPWRI